MPAGLQVYNSDGVFQIDGEFKNLCLRSKVTVTCNVATSNGTNNNYASAAQNYSGITNLVIALRSSATCMVYWVSATQFVIISDTNGASVTVYLFGDPPAASGTSGLQVYNATGQLVFDSDRQYMRVAGFQIMSAHFATYNYPAGKTYATIASGGFWGRTIATGAPPGASNYYLSEWQRPGWSWSGTTLTMAGISTYFSFFPDSAGPITYESLSDTFILVLDVTGY